MANTNTNTINATSVTSSFGMFSKRELKEIRKYGPIFADHSLSSVADAIEEALGKKIDLTSLGL